MSGAINEALNWRWTFRVLGVLGLVLVPLGAIALWEPKAVRDQRQARQEGKTSYSIKVGRGVCWGGERVRALSIGACIC